MGPMNLIAWNPKKGGQLHDFTAEQGRFASPATFDLLQRRFFGFEPVLMPHDAMVQIPGGFFQGALIDWHFFLAGVEMVLRRADKNSKRTHVKCGKEQFQRNIDNGHAWLGQHHITFQDMMMLCHHAESCSPCQRLGTEPHSPCVFCFNMIA